VRIAHLEGSRLLDPVENFTVFSEHKAGLVRIIGQNLEFLGVNNAIGSMLAARKLNAVQRLAPGGEQGSIKPRPCPALTGLETLLSNTFPGPALRSSPGYRIPGLQPFQAELLGARRLCGPGSIPGPADFGMTP